MAQKYGLFNSVGGSPAYNDVDLAEMFSLITGSAGYVAGYGSELVVTAGAGLQVLVAAGGAWLGDPPGWWYINNEMITLSLDAEVGGYSRIDRVVLRLDRNTDALSITAEILKGTPAASGPTVPVLTKNSTVYEFSLAKVLVTGGGTSIAVTDERDTSGRIVLNGALGEVTETDSFTLGFKHLGRIIKCNKATAMTVTIPTNDLVAFPIGSEIAFYRYGAGTVTVAPATGVVLRTPNSADDIGAQYASCATRKIGTNEWLLSGYVI